MTKAEISATMDSIRARIEENVSLYNEANQEDRMPDVRRLEALLKDDKKEYNSFALKLCQKECLEAENPMLEAITRYTYKTLTYQNETVDDLPVRTVSDAWTPIDLLALDQKAGKKGIGVNPEWKYMLEALTQELSIEVDRGVTPEEKWGEELLNLETTYYIRRLALKYKEAHTVDENGNMTGSPMSNTKLTQKLTDIIQAMLGPDYYATKRDVNYMKSIFVQGSSAELDENGHIKAIKISVTSYKNAAKELVRLLNMKLNPSIEIGITGYKKVKAK